MATQQVVKFDDIRMRKFLKRITEKGKAAAQHREEFATLIKASIFADIMDHFDKESGPDGKWEPYSFSYEGAILGEFHFRKIAGRTVMLGGPDPNPQSGKMKKRDLGQLLRDGGDLRQSIQPKTGKHKAGRSGIMYFTDQKTKSGFPYAAAHNIGGKKLPRRRFMWLSKKAKEKILKETLQWMLRKGI